MCNEIVRNNRRGEQMNKKIVLVLILSTLLICAGIIPPAQAEEQKSSKKIISYIGYTKEYNTKSDNVGIVKINLYNKGSATETVKCSIMLYDIKNNYYRTSTDVTTEIRSRKTNTENFEISKSTLLSLIPSESKKYDGKIKVRIADVNDNVIGTKTFKVTAAKENVEISSESDVKAKQSIFDRIKSFFNI